MLETNKDQENQQKPDVKLQKDFLTELKKATAKQAEKLGIEEQEELSKDKDMKKREGESQKRLANIGKLDGDLVNKVKESLDQALQTQAIGSAQQPQPVVSAPPPPPLPLRSPQQTAVVSEVALQETPPISKVPPPPPLPLRSPQQTAVVSEVASQETPPISTVPPQQQVVINAAPSVSQINESELSQGMEQNSFSISSASSDLRRNIEDIKGNIENEKITYNVPKIEDGEKNIAVDWSGDSKKDNSKVNIQFEQGAFSATFPAEHEINARNAIVVGMLDEINNKDLSKYNPIGVEDKRTLLERTRQDDYRAVIKDAVVSTQEENNKVANILQEEPEDRVKSLMKANLAIMQQLKEQGELGVAHEQNSQYSSAMQMTALAVTLKDLGGNLKCEKTANGGSKVSVEIDTTISENDIKNAIEIFKEKNKVENITKEDYQEINDIAKICKKAEIDALIEQSGNAIVNGAEKVIENAKKAIHPDDCNLKDFEKLAGIGSDEISIVAKPKQGENLEKTTEQQPLQEVEKPAIDTHVTSISATEPVKPPIAEVLTEVNNNKKNPDGTWKTVEPATQLNKIIKPEDKKNAYATGLNVVSQPNSTEQMTKQDPPSQGSFGEIKNRFGGGYEYRPPSQERSGVRYEGNRTVSTEQMMKQPPPSQRNSVEGYDTHTPSQERSEDGYEQRQPSQRYSRNEERPVTQLNNPIVSTNDKKNPDGSWKTVEPPSRLNKLVKQEDRKNAYATGINTVLKSSEDKPITVETVKKPNFQSYNKLEEKLQNNPQAFSKISDIAGKLAEKGIAGESVNNAGPTGQRIKSTTGLEEEKGGRSM